MSAVGGRNSTMSPVLIGAIAVLAIVIGTFLAYNANRGLPWVPYKALTVEVGDAANIVPGNEVRIGGTRVGIVSGTRPKQYPDGRTTALLDLQLDQTTEELPVDTTVLIRARSLLGLKYVQLTPGQDNRTFDWGGEVPLANATPEPVEVDQLLNTFNDPTRIGIQQVITAFGNAIAGRGSVLRQLIDDAAPLARDLEPVARILADEENGLVPFLRALTGVTDELAASGDSLGSLIRNLDRTAGAVADAGPALDETLRTAPGALADTRQALATTRASVGPHIRFAEALQPGVDAIANAAPRLASASQAAADGFAATPRFSRDFRSVLEQLDAVSRSQAVATGLDGVAQAARSGRPLINALSRTQRVCGYGSLVLRNIASLTFDGNAVGRWIRIGATLPAYAPNSETTPATAPSQPSTPPEGAYAGIVTGDQYRTTTSRATALYTNPQPVVGQGGVCEPGYEARPVNYPQGSRDRANPIANADPVLTVSNPTLVSATPFKPSPPAGSSFAEQGAQR